jgi:ABC-type nickel/cobalt efflux system permease component RcnA
MMRRISLRSASFRIALSIQLSLPLLVLFMLVAPRILAAHPLDEYYQVTYITVAPNRINLSVELYPSVLIAPQLLALIDANQDDRFSEVERQAYVDLFSHDVSAEIDGVPVDLQATEIEFPSALDLRSGGGVIRFKLHTDLPADHRGDHQFFYQNNHMPDIGVYLVNALSDAPSSVRITNQDRDVLQSSVSLDYAIAAGTPLDYGTSDQPAEIEVPGEVSGGQEQLAQYLYDPNQSALYLAVVFGLAIALGGLHALTPGHGKTLVAAYLIGSRGTIGHAVFLGGIVTFTHTASVIAIGLVALFASQYILPNLLVPGLEVLAGLLVVVMGGQLIRARWQDYHLGREPEHHNHSHSHNGHSHHHPEQVKVRDLMTLGISGGLVPCPEALGIMLIAIGLNRISMGLGMVVAFSFGLAAVLIVIGVLLVRARSVLDRFGQAGGRWQHLLPMTSAVIVTLLGLGIMAKGLMPLLAG